MGKEGRKEKDRLTDKQLENVIGGMSPEKFRAWREEALNERRLYQDWKSSKRKVR